MTFYTKQPPFGATPGEFYQGDVRKSFNFFYFAHSDHHEMFKSLLRDKQQRYALFDLAACYAAQLQYRDMLKLDNFVEHALRYFRLALQTRGYNLATDENIVEGSKDFDHTVLLITGCQTPEVRNARVDAAYEAVRCLNVPSVDVVFSGAHPPAAASATDRGPRSEKYPIEPDEAGAMDVWFSQRRRSDLHPLAAKTVCYKESSSTRTKENVENFLREHRFDPAQDTHLLIASSTFHLPRLADELEAHLSVERPGLKRITLISAEDHAQAARSELMQHQMYIKQMMFELFRLMFVYDLQHIDSFFEREISLRL
jgi:hypothetical protein